MNDAEKAWGSSRARSRGGVIENGWTANVMGSNPISKIITNIKLKYSYNIGKENETSV